LRRRCVGSLGSVPGCARPLDLAIQRKGVGEGGGGGVG